MHGELQMDPKRNGDGKGGFWSENDQSLLVDASERRLSKIGRLLCLVLLGQVHIGESVCLNTMLTRETVAESTVKMDNTAVEIIVDSTTIPILRPIRCVVSAGRLHVGSGYTRQWMDASAKYCYDDTGNGSCTIWRYVVCT